MTVKELWNMVGGDCDSMSVYKNDNQVFCEARTVASMYGFNVNDVDPEYADKEVEEFHTSASYNYDDHEYHTELYVVLKK